MKHTQEERSTRRSPPPARPRTRLIPVEGSTVPRIGHKWSVGEAPNVRRRTSTEVYEEPADARQDAGSYVTGQLQRAERRGKH